MNRPKRVAIIVLCFLIFLALYDTVPSMVSLPDTQALIPIILAAIALLLSTTSTISYFKKKRAKKKQTVKEDSNSNSTLSPTPEANPIKRLKQTNKPTSQWVNRETLQQLFQQTREQWLPDQYALVLIDAPNFKELISILGYQQSDQLVRQVSSQLNHHLSSVSGSIVLPSSQENESKQNESGQNDIYISHLDYCQFAFFLDTGDQDDQAVSRARALLTGLKDSLLIDLLPVYNNPCVGISLSNESDLDFYELLRQAQIAATQAADNHHRIERYHTDLEPKAQEKNKLMGELKRAIEIDALEIFYQPQINLDQKKIVGVEALIHWHHPELGIVAPNKFIPIAESTGLIKDLTEWTINQAIKDASIALSVMPSLKISINISPYNLLQTNFTADFLSKIQQEQITPEQITLEIKENTLLKNNALPLKILQDLKLKGVNLSIDDFGTSYGSLKYLRNSPVNEIKIHEFFINGLDKSKTDQTIVKSIINLSHNMGITVVAEGVKTAAILELLKSYNCDTGQGLLFSEPLKISALLESLAVSANQPYFVNQFSQQP
ncbi:MAG: hypothetical protein COB04_10785 [Gammaproteobacteria bacterium]|nr:MAG: hypothetical protein COB04_10785 [Gammaproteobacteria bacterium]